MDRLLKVAELAQVLGISPNAVTAACMKAASPCRHHCLSPTRPAYTGASPMSRPGLRRCRRAPPAARSRAGIKERAPIEDDEDAMWEKYRGL